MITSFSNYSNQHCWCKAILVGLVFIATEFLGGIFVGGITVRNVAIIILIIYICSKPRSLQHHFINLNILVLYYAFVSFLGLFNGFYERDGVVLLLARFLPTIVIAFFLLFFIKTKKELQCTVYVIIIILILDAFATLLQGINHPLGWSIASFFQSQESFEETQNLIDSYNAETTIGFSIASGFCGSVVINGYVLGAFGLLLFLPLYWNFNKKMLLSSVICFFLFSTALFYNQQRMAFYVFHIAVATITVVYMYIKKNYILLSLIVVVSVLFLIVFDVNNFFNDDLGRLSNFNDEIRQRGRTIYWNDFFPNNFLLGNRTKFLGLYGSTPHFLPIETLLYGGIVGLIIFSFFVFSFARNFVRSIFMKNSECFLMGTPIAALLLISLRHSSGFHTGLSTCAYMLSLFNLSIYLLKKQ